MTTPSPQEVEKIRQGIMRMRELLDILHHRLEEGESAYLQLFAGLSPGDTDGLKEKEIQRLAAYDVLKNRTLLTRPALALRLLMRDMEREFEQLHDNVLAEIEDED